MPHRTTNDSHIRACITLFYFRSTLKKHIFLNILWYIMELAVHVVLSFFAHILTFFVAYNFLKSRLYMQFFIRNFVALCLHMCSVSIPKKYYFKHKLFLKSRSFAAMQNHRKWKLMLIYEMKDVEEKFKIYFQIWSWLGVPILWKSSASEFNSYIIQ